jgi:hypothetical protein
MKFDVTEFVDAELARLDLLLHRQILRLRARYQLSLDEFRGLYISDAHVDSLVANLRSNNSPPDFTDLDARAVAMRRVNCDAFATDSPWNHLASQLNLSTFEMDVILLAFAPHFDLKYEVLYAYLNNDVSRKWPTLDLALQLFSGEKSERSHLRSSLLPQSPLFRLGLLQTVNESPAKPAWLAQGFSLNHSVAHSLLGHPVIDSALAPVLKPVSLDFTWSDLRISSAVQSRLMRVPELLRTKAEDLPLFIFAGPCAAEKAAAAQAVCSDLHMNLHEFDLQTAQHSPDLFPTLSRALSLELLLRPSALYITNTAALWDADPKLAADAWRLLLSLLDNRTPIFISAHHPEHEIAAVSRQHLSRLKPSRRCITIEFQTLPYPERRAAWDECLSKEIPPPALPSFPPAFVDDLASRFTLSHSQIQDTIRAAQQNHALSEHSADPLREEDLLEAARAQSGHELGRLAPKVQLVHTWHDLVLPEATLRQVRETASAIRHQQVVYAEWGFGQRLAASRGLKILLAGASGTGKTMTAAVVARDLGLDLYKIDLASVVSKYIGETEKNLDRIFGAAQSSNAILFFDEADALFGKRSEVNDAHDRYANIEVAYLLQKMEEHDGAVILASHLSRNIDQAFSRRMHYVVEFPLPAEPQRTQLWRGMFPPDAPVSGDVDFTFLARQFPISGGDIKNVVLAAAFLAAQDGRIITMRHLIDAMRQQSIKRGKVPAAADFKQYHTQPGRTEAELAGPDFHQPTRG